MHVSGADTPRLSVGVIVIIKPSFAVVARDGSREISSSHDVTSTLEYRDLFQSCVTFVEWSVVGVVRVPYPIHMYGVPPFTQPGYEPPGTVPLPNGVTTSLQHMKIGRVRSPSPGPAVKAATGMIPE